VVFWSARCSWRYAVWFSSCVLNHLALFILDICCVEFWKSLLLLELRMRVFKVFLQSWNISCFFLVFSLQIRIGDTYNPFYFKKYSEFFFVWFISFSCPPAIQSRVEPFSEIACLVWMVSVLSICDFVLFKHWMLLEVTTHLLMVKT